MVHNTVGNWGIKEATGHNKGILTTLSVSTRHQTYAFHNVYNHNQSLNFDTLGSVLQSATEAHILGGDSNLKHTWWAEDDAQSSPGAEEPVRILSLNQMILKNEPGVAIYTRGDRDADTPKSAIDLVFKSDHTISEISVDMQVERPTNLRYRWHYTPQRDFEKFVEKVLAKMFGEHDSVTELEDQAAAEVMSGATKEFVPVEILSEPKQSRAHASSTVPPPADPVAPEESCTGI
ncbi:hypothetical protein P280DRAFT_513105 [Massarina eburnea CBS 473.64]|uniref:Endonuclease/exonuclease/phosphatase domain-containing protein n=1 Tax=Massarina eburnea CBS 473.64 TaxID=1395130 RepID=A0A6A6SBK7_9PLEO|nr:hypothetical protein P280DRAFT_513105 [Massarina eburnea CBS 473.64]